MMSCTCHYYRATNKNVDVRLSECDADLSKLVKVSYKGQAFIGVHEHRKAVGKMIAERVLGRSLSDVERIAFFDRDHLHLCRANIAVVSTSDRLRYHGPHRDTSSQFKGVSWQKSRQKWYAAIRINGRYTNLGRYEKERDAAAAYNYALLRLGIDVAYVNDIDSGSDDKEASLKAPLRGGKCDRQ